MSSCGVSSVGWRNEHMARSGWGEGKKKESEFVSGWRSELEGEDALSL